MAATSASSAYLTAVGAVGAAVASAAFVVEGRWEPVSLTLGWLVVALVASSVVLGGSAGLATAAALHVVRVAVHGVAGDRTPGLAMAAVLLVAMVELGAASLEARQIPLDLGSVLARVVIAVAGGGVAVAAVVIGVGSSAPVGGGSALMGLAAAMTAGGLVLWVQRRADTG